MKSAERGFNLISLMVGMTLSVISVLAMLSLYKNMVGVSGTFIQESRQDGQITAALLTARHELRNAGFWLPAKIPAEENRLILLSGADLNNGSMTASSKLTLSTSDATGNAIVWAYQTDSAATATCAGLLVKNGQLLSLKAASSCTQTAQWNSTTWTATSLIEAGQPSTFFKVNIADCWPFGKTGTIPSRVKVTMTATTSTVDVSSTASNPVYVKNTSEVCLPSLSAPTT